MRTDVATWTLSSPQTSAEDPFFGPGLRLPAEPLSKHGAAGGAARQRAGGTRRGDGGEHGGPRTTRYLMVRCRTLEEPWVGDEELLLLRSSSDRSRPLPLSEPGLPFSVLSMSYLEAHGDTGTGETWHPDTGRHPPGVPRAGDVGDALLNPSHGASLAPSRPRWGRAAPRTPTALLSPWGG